jgi:DNA invertase Pin-like site-specific DNA recombinase
MTPRRCVILARVSTLKKGQDESPARQIEEGRRYAAAQGWEVVAELEERVSGAKGESERPALAEALRLIRAGKASALWVSRLDRLGRRLGTLIEVAEELKRRGAALIVADMLGGGMVDTGSPMGGFAFHMLGSVGEFVRATYAEAAIAGKERARQAGKIVHRPPEDLPLDQRKEVARYIEGMEGLRTAWTWGKVARHLYMKGMLMPGRYVKAEGRMRPAKAWSRSTLQRAWSRAQKPRPKTGSEVVESGGENPVE